MRRDLKMILLTAKVLGVLALQMMIFPVMVLTVLSLKLAGKESAATEVQDWWLHL